MQRPTNGGEMELTNSDLEELERLGKTIADRAGISFKRLEQHNQSIARIHLGGIDPLGRAEMVMEFKKEGEILAPVGR